MKMNNNRREMIKTKNNNKNKKVKKINRIMNRKTINMIKILNLETNKKKIMIFLSHILIEKLFLYLIERKIIYN
jgi:hypothetical protein